MFITSFNFLSENITSLLHELCIHLYLCGVSLAIAIVLALPLGIVMARLGQLRNFTLSLASITQTIPSLAAMAILVPIFGIGVVPTLIILAFYAIYPIFKNTVVGLRALPAETLEAALAMGLNAWQRLYMVELPLAMPNIIAGIRIATAMTIGIATIAAFIGAGGLGTFITQGLALNDMRLVMLGAIPAAMLALCADFLISMSERFVVRRSKRQRRGVLLLIVFAMGIGFLLCYFFRDFSISQNATVIVGSKNFTEQYILAEIIAQMLEAKTDLKIKRKFNLGTTDTVHQAMLFGDIDIYPEYTGTAYLTILRKHKEGDKEEIFLDVKQEYLHRFDLTWLLPFGFSNAQTIAVSKELAERYGLKTLSNLSAVAPQISIGAPAEFIERRDAYPKLKAVYQLRFKSIKQMDPNLMYNAIRNHKVDAIVSFATDSRPQELELVMLEDDKQSSLPYEAAPVVRSEVLRRYPQIKDALLLLANAIDQKTMAEMNALVEQKRQSPKAVAREFLKHILVLDKN